ncbi:transcriptional regulator [Mycolicibacterium chubuense NBB4]|uniref:Transcriptional regulator n=1 Tax=Mycolicibacterium chubuense (strain NBB4) TaxID=710421 RepID=I4BR46_MYCCN|nr:FMN-binding negative transcriptional regulator [Mycolicibacterium chubuense]AFM19753.1 transcriptional regulator [Mycolicibacterium chubuense NBB4]
MYIPPKFALSDEATRAALAPGGFAYLVTHQAEGVGVEGGVEGGIEGGIDGMLVTPLPLLYDGERHSLIGHVARANPHWRAAGRPTVAIFGGAQAYISPSLYATKRETGKVVPTWNHDVLTVHGSLSAHDDREWLRGLVTRLTAHHEQGRPDPWRVTDAPESFVTGQLGGIVGVELTITAVEGKAKMSQNQPERNRRGVIDGLRESGDPAAQAVAARVAEEGQPPIE